MCNVWISIFNYETRLQQYFLNDERSLTKFSGRFDTSRINDPNFSDLVETIVTNV